HERALDLCALHEVADPGEPGGGRVEVIDEKPQPLLVVGATEVAQTGGAHRSCGDVLEAADVSAFAGHGFSSVGRAVVGCGRSSALEVGGPQLSWNSPQSTLSMVPVTAEARSLAKKSAARATSSGVARRFRSVGAAFSAYTSSWVRP